MASIWRRDDNYVEEPNRNTVDYSFQNNLTTDFGSLRPCLCVPVVPGDSLSIETTFGLKFLPMAFPVQTRMKASVHYFYVRNRNLWKDWMDFIGKTKQGLVPPYIHLTEQNRKQVETCELGDFLGIPTELYGSAERTLVKADSQYGYYDTNSEDFESSIPCFVPTQVANFTRKEYVGVSYDDDIIPYTNSIPGTPYMVYQSLLNITSNEYSNYRISFGLIDNELNFSEAFVSIYDAFTGEYVASKYIESLNDDFDDFEINFGDVLGSPNETKLYIFNFIPKVTFQPTLKDRLMYQLEYKVKIDNNKSVSELSLTELPWRSDGNPNGIPLSALPFRAYESIYNVYYRNAENNPFMINGVPEYNKWIRTNEGGADTNLYELMYHNWEDDFLTTAVPSPQQGNAPLVGLTGSPTVTIGHDDGTTTEMSLEVDENGSVTAAHAVSGDEVTQRALVDAVNYGITINDFRNVNSFQRWLENNIRRGYKYKDQIKTHYGVSVRYDELDMPEFIGGTSQPVLVNQISQTVPTLDQPLGAMAGQASAVGQGKRITHYCDEHGFIIGILCVKPVANYSQLLPKYFNVTDTFDYYFPEFGHIGMQPILNSEVTPLQAHIEGKLNDVFGYQRAWYDLIGKTDEVHGLFRTDFRNFLINRTFDGTPELGKEFTVIDPNQVNDVFAYTGNTDKILGQVYMDISKKTPIPLYGIPKLE